jgi:hypothetical protein
MKRNELIELLKTLPEDAEICSTVGDDILGDYSFNTDLSLYENDGYLDNKGTIWTGYSNYRRFGDKEVKVWVIS